MEIQYLQRAIAQTAVMSARIMEYEFIYYLQVEDGINEYNGRIFDAVSLSREIKEEVNVFSNLISEVQREFERNAINLKKVEYRRYFNYCDEKITMMLSPFDDKLIDQYNNDKKNFLSKIAVFYSISDHPAIPELYSTYAVHRIIGLKEFVEKKAPGKALKKPHQSSLKEKFVTDDAYDKVMAILSDEGFTDKNSGKWIDISKGYKGRIIALIHDLAYKNYYKNSSTIPNPATIIEIAKNTFGVTIAESTIKDATRSGNNTSTLRACFAIITRYNV